MVSCLVSEAFYVHPKRDAKLNMDDAEASAVQSNA